LELKKALHNIEYKIIVGDEKINFDSLEIDTRKDLENTLFICLKGQNHDTHKNIDEVLKNGVNVIVLEEGNENYNDSVLIENYKNNGVAIIAVKNTRSFMALVSKNFYGFNNGDFKLIGVTGTNGKTTITHFINSILLQNKQNTGVIGTIGNRINNVEMDIEIVTSTTPDPMQLHEIFSEMKKENVKNVVMEATSHALALNKLDGIDFEIGIFSNLTQDHLDFHGSMENYLDEKLKLFRKSEIGIVNIDDEHAENFIKACKGKAVTYGIDNDCDFRAENIKYMADKTAFDVKIDGNIENFSLHMQGKFMVYNVLASIVACIYKGLSVSDIKKAVAKLSVVPGRFEDIKNNLGIKVIVDYSHTPDSLKNILEAVRDFTKGKVIAVGGCGGDRDPLKRPIMGQMLYDFSDVAVFTTDNPRSEVPDHIVIEMVQGLKIKKEDNKICKLSVNRRDAIKMAIDFAEEGDTVVIAGKGHEDYQELNNKVKIFFDDRIEADNYMKESEDKY